jgi:hypothetical protein
VIWEDDFSGDTNGGSAAVTGGYGTINGGTGDWTNAQMTSKATSTAADNYVYTFKIGAAPTGNYDMFQVFGGNAQAPYVAMRGDIDGVNNWTFYVRQETGNEYHGTATSAIAAGDTWSFHIGSSGSSVYKNGALFDSTSLVPTGTLMVDAQAWHEPGVSVASQSFDYIGVSVPEPGTFALCATALFGLLCYAWRKRK